MVSMMASASRPVVHARYSARRHDNQSTHAPVYYRAVDGIGMTHEIEIRGSRLQSGSTTTWASSRSPIRHRIRAQEMESSCPPVFAYFGEKRARVGRMGVGESSPDPVLSAHDPFQYRGIGVI
jgi:hypothetical protein